MGGVGGGGRWAYATSKLYFCYMKSLSKSETLVFEPCGRSQHFIFAKTVHVIACAVTCNRKTENSHEILHKPG